MDTTATDTTPQYIVRPAPGGHDVVRTKDDVAVFFSSRLGEAYTEADRRNRDSDVNTLRQAYLLLLDVRDDEVFSSLLDVRLGIAATIAKLVGE